MNDNLLEIQDLEVSKKRGNPIVEDRVVYWHQRTNYYSLAASSSFL